MIETKRDVRLVLGAIVVSAIVAVVVAAADGGNWLAGRSGGAIGPNSIGLLSGFILLIAAFGAVTPKVPHRIALALVALVGLLIAKSVASFVATGFALALGAALVAGASPTQRVTRVAVAVGVAATLVFGVVQIFRPEVTPGSQDFRGSSASHRLLVMTAGLEVFERNPVIGAGWRQSSNPQVVGDREVAIDVRRRFPAARHVNYPDVNPTTVHNTYVQILAEWGLVGFVLFAALVVAVATRTRQLLRRMGANHDLRREAWVMALGLLMLLVWLNETPLFGGQPPTVIGALLVGALAATSRIVAEPARARPPVAAPGRPLRRRDWRATEVSVATAWAGSRPSPFLAERAAASAVAETPSAGPTVGRAKPGARPAARARPWGLPGTGRRIALAAAIVAAAGVAGLLAGRWTADDGKTTEVGPNQIEPAVSDYRTTVSREIERLGATRASDLPRLRRARTPGDQASASAALARAHERSARSLARAPAPTALRRSRESVVESLRRVASSYRRLGAAAASRDASAYGKARRAVRLAEASLQRDLATIGAGS